MTTTRPESRSPSRSHPSRALISRIAAPFSPRPRYISDLLIDTADPRRNYAPGDAVRGNVTFTAHKAIKLTHLVVQLYGFVRIYKNATPPGEGIPAEASAASSFQSLRSGRARSLGSITIFEEEVVLCGQGTLGPGRYQVPFSVRFPAAPLPSSLDFERGTISYILSTVLTRPTTVVPTMAHERKVFLRETVDVSSLNTPKQRAISLKPVSRRVRNRMPNRTEERERPAALSQQDTPTTSTEGDSPRDGRTPSISEQSAASILSTNSGRQTHSHLVESEQASLSSMDDLRVITASVDILREGYLPGDVVPVRVIVKHTKPIKAMQGVIVTLYRRGRIDGSSIIEDARDASDRDEFIPRSRTGLGGLFASGSISHNFRYDLDQTIAPLVVNPNTMQGEVKTSVRLPDEIFPTITCVPHGLITFTYHVEVVMDLGAKLSAADRLLPRLSMTRAATNYELGESHGQSAYNQAGATRRIFDTVAIRRLESIAHCTFDIVVGTKDSKRKVTKKAADPWAEAHRTYVETNPFPWGRHAGPDGQERQNGSPSIRTEYTGEYSVSGSLPIIPPPEQEEELNEKERMRRHEERVLPSRPYHESSLQYEHAGPSAPPSGQLEVAAEVGRLPQANRYSQSTIRPAEGLADDMVDEKERFRRHEAALMPSSPSDVVQDSSEDLYDGPLSEPSAPAPSSLNTVVIRNTSSSSADAGSYLQETMQDISNVASSTWAGYPSTVVDDKQELERRRLMATASQPGYDELDTGQAAHDMGALLVASAPPEGMDRGGSSEDVEIRSNYHQAAWESLDGVEHLPEYQR